MSSKLYGITKENIEKLKRYQAIEMYVSRLLGGWLPGIARWEVKHDVGLHIWENSENSRDLRTRLWELRVTNPDRGVIDLISPAFQELARAQHDYEVLAGLYLVLKQNLLEAYQAYIDNTFDVYDYPTIPVLKKIIAITETHIDWANRALNQLTDTGEKKRNVNRWMQFTRDVIDAIGGINGDTLPHDTMPTPPPAYATPLPFSDARRDERFDLQVALPPMPDKHAPEWTAWHFMGYATEMQAAETLATCLWEVEGMDWEFYYDISRHCWDEIRHSQLGCRRLEQLGHHISDFPHSVGSYAWRQLFHPVIRYCALTYVIEADSFSMKHEMYQHYQEQNDHESAQAIMYDIIDETLHVRLGTKWVAPLMNHFGYTQTVNELVDECRDIVLSHSVSPAQKQQAQRVIASKNK